MSIQITNTFNFEKKKNFLFILLGVCIFFLSKSNGMFWDNVLFASKMGNHLFDNSIFNWTIPNEFDPGHPPFLGFLLAISWKILGHKLWVSHLLILPFTIGVFHQLYKFISYFIKERKPVFIWNNPDHNWATSVSEVQYKIESARANTRTKHTTACACQVVEKVINSLLIFGSIAWCANTPRHALFIRPKALHIAMRQFECLSLWVLVYYRRQRCLHSEGLEWKQPIFP